MAKDIVWVAEMETPNFSFIGLGKTRDEAEKALAQRWNLHAKIYELPRWNQGMGNSTTVGDYFGVHNRPLRLGSGYLDSESED